MIHTSYCCHVEVTVTLFGPSRSDTRKDMQPTISFLPNKRQRDRSSYHSAFRIPLFGQRLEKVENRVLGCAVSNMIITCATSVVPVYSMVATCH